METKVDEKDLEILSILEKNAKTRIHLIAKKLHLPPSTVHHRIKRMEEAGIISGWGVRKNYSKLGLKVKAYVMVFVDVTALKHMKKTQKDIAGAIRKIENVECADIITGDSDLLVCVRCKDIEDFQKVLLGKLQSIEGITKTKTLMVIGES
jgi:Lrp/AsnC family transcriptional regulator for asnA, asnC and gidA